MTRSSLCARLLVPLALVAMALPASSQTPDLDRWKQELAADIDGRARFTADIVDQIFSFGELGFQEFETSAYLVGLLRDNGFTVEGSFGDFSGEPLDEDSESQVIIARARRSGR